MKKKKISVGLIEKRYIVYNMEQMKQSKSLFFFLFGFHIKIRQASFCSYLSVLKIFSSGKSRYLENRAKLVSPKERIMNRVFSIKVSLYYGFYYRVRKIEKIG